MGGSDVPSWRGSRRFCGGRKAAASPQPPLASVTEPCGFLEWVASDNPWRVKSIRGGSLGLQGLEAHRLCSASVLSPGPLQQGTGGGGGCGLPPETGCAALEGNGWSACLAGLQQSVVASLQDSLQCSQSPDKLRLGSVAATLGLQQVLHSGRRHPGQVQLNEATALGSPGMPLAPWKCHTRSVTGCRGPPQGLRLPLAQPRCPRRLIKRSPLLSAVPWAHCGLANQASGKTPSLVLAPGRLTSLKGKICNHGVMLMPLADQAPPWETAWRGGGD